MSLVSLAHVNKSFGAQTVLEDLSLQVYPGDRVGLIGANGSGKTTLLRLISGLDTPDTGTVNRARQTRIGYLAQEPALDESHRVFQAATEAFADLREMEQHLRRLEEAMADATGRDLDRLVWKHGDLQHRYEARGGYEQERRAEAVLMGLGFERDRLEAEVRTLSGGERSRLALGRLLLRDPDLLLLDEPTNHLDIDGIRWFEAYLSRQKAGIMLVSHDRYLLDRAVTRILELERAQGTSYRGNYSDHVRQKAAQRLTQERAYRYQKAMIQKEEQFIRRYHAGQRAKEARGRQRRLDRVERMERPTQASRAKINFQADRRGGDLIARMDNVGKWFGANVLFRGLSFDVQRGERVGIVGPNGSGKTTLLRIMLGWEPPSEGECRMGQNLAIGYLDQLLAGLDPAHTALEEVWQLRRTLAEQDVRDLLARFLLTGDHVFKKISELSGGERARVALAKTMLTKPNVLVLDEPTNHLDIPGRQALEEALSAFVGTVIVVSHDRYFLDRIVRRLLVISGGSARAYQGNYALYESRLAEAAAAARGAARTPERPRESPPARSRPKPADKPRPLEEIEAEIEALEEEQRAITARLGRQATYLDAKRVRSLKQRYEQIEHALHRLNAEWETHLA